MRSPLTAHLYWPTPSGTAVDDGCRVTRTNPTLLVLRRGKEEQLTNTRAIKEIKFIQEMGQDPELENH